MKVEFSYYDKYLKIALDNYENIGELKKELEGIRERTKHIEKSSDQEAYEVALRYDAMSEHAMVAVVFSALSSEAYINDYAISRLSNNYFKTYLDKLDLLPKWIVIPRIVLGKQLDPGSRALQELSWLINMRNKLVHFKSRTVRIDQIRDSDFVQDYDAARAIETVRKLVLALKDIDEEINIYWLRNR